MKQHKQRHTLKEVPKEKQQRRMPHVEAAVAAQEQKEAETAKKKTQAEGWTNEGATGSRSKKTESSDDEIKRLIKEKRTIAREDKQQLKEVRKRIKKCIRIKNKCKKERGDTADP